jgi:O-antigen/teichoic acid export membrane protein
LLYRFDLFYLLFPAGKLSSPIVMSLAIIPVVFFNLFTQGIIVGENKIVLNNYITLGSQGALALTLTILSFTGSLSVASAITMYALSHLLAFAGIVGTSAPRMATIARAKIRWNEYRTMLGYSLTIHAGNLTQFFNYRLDAFVVNYFLGAGAVGLYMIASALGETLWLLSASMASVLFPTIAGQHEKSKEIAIKGAVGALGLSVLGGGVGFLAGPIIIPLLFGDKFTGSIDPFLILIPGVAVFSITNVLSTYLAGTGNPRYSATISFLAFLLTVILDLVLIPKYGIAGAATASTVSYSVSSLLSVLAFFKISGMTAREVLNVVMSMSHDVRSIVHRLRRLRDR